ncbi:MAG: class I SAM-dependent methyltransferase [bacterium]
MMFGGKKLTFARIIGYVKWRISKRIFRKWFPVWQRLGFHLTKNHYYSPIPDTSALKDELWQRPSELIGVDLNEERQLELLSDFVARFKDEYGRIPANSSQVSKPYEYYLNNRYFESVDGEFYYCMIRRFKPRKIIEIGAGWSTLLAAQAVLKNRDEDSSYDCELVAIEPHPSGFLKAGFPGLSRLILQKAEDVPLPEFETLTGNDFLFIDSSHVLKIGSDVQYEYLEILPRLNRGVIIHSHDIFFPMEYPKALVLKDCRFWSEQYLLQAFLAFNDSFEVLWAGYYMHLRHPDKLEWAFSSYKRDAQWPLSGSFWFRRRK